MIFGDIPTIEAEGAILVHSIRRGDVNFKKGRVLSAGDVATLAAANIVSVAAVRLEADDVVEDEAAAALAPALAGENIRVAAPFTGRVNLFAKSDGVLAYDRERLDAINLIDEGITVALLAPFESVVAGQMIGTIKIIPFAVPRAALDQALSAAEREAAPLVSVATFTAHKVGLVATQLAGTKQSVMDKTRRILDQRLAAMGSHIAKELRCDHTEADVARSVAALLAEGLSPVLVFGASAITDRRDVVPAGIVAAGGEIEHFGMPVDPGNLMLLARAGETPVLGLPGCARSPALNGFDWVLARLLAGLEVTRADIMRMGAGGLLKEIASRPQPREGKPMKPSEPRIAAVVLGAGKSSRMGATNKLTTEVDGTPMIARAVEAASGNSLSPIVVVTGHEAEKVKAALAGQPVSFVHNPDYAEGLSTSLRAGVRALPDDIDAVLVCLGDMPDISADHVARLIAAFDPDEGRTICVPTVAGKRGNPILWGASFLPEFASLKGDTGARHLLGEHAEAVCEVPMPDDAALRDIDTPEELAAHRKPS